MQDSGKRNPFAGGNTYLTSYLPSSADTHHGGLAGARSIVSFGRSIPAGITGATMANKGAWVSGNGHNWEQIENFIQTEEQWLITTYKGLDEAIITRTYPGEFVTKINPHIKQLNQYEQAGLIQKFIARRTAQLRAWGWLPKSLDKGEVNK